ncbi:MAG: hypothetical protein EOP86_15840 [Verrucomicrobiaceae bacterium]|nr:MAG: hypothetical protein EOP86_15840 [Verrucomicrobiaceae bacterium]
MDGTVGYEFLSRLNRLWMDENKAGELSALYSAFTGESGDYPSLVPQKKRQVIRLLFRRELEYLVELALRVADREYGLPAPSRDCLREAIVALSVELPVYRTYKRGAELSDGDAEILRMALGRARTHHPDSGQEAFDLLERMLLEGNAEMGSEWVARWQQFTGPVTAKGLEDTAFYDFSRLISANEVGGEPGMAGISAESFHEFCDGMQRNRPGSLLLTATHDTKRGEDVRTRISVLSEQPAEWAEAVAAWSVMNAAGWGNHQPDRHMEYFLYQTLAGAWPLEEKRCQEYMLKACRESKRHTTWLYPDEGYERGLREFISHLYQSPEFISSLEKFLQPLVLAGHGNSLAQTLIKLTAPGVPDIYQGCELPEFSLVDPDNRRPVDFEARRRLLDGFEARAAPPSWQASESKL